MTQTNKLTEQEKRALAEKRASELRNRIADYLEVKDSITTGFNARERIKRQKKLILDVLGATEDQWTDWKWQIRNRIYDVDVLAAIVNMSPREKEIIREVGSEFRWAISPYYASLMDPTDINCPVRKQAIPCINEVEDPHGVLDPMGEELTSPAPAITRRYPDRLIVNVTNQCAMYCRHCQRRRNIGEVDKNVPRELLSKALDYIRANEEIRDVLITGGDALMLTDNTLDWLLGELDEIPHVEIKRLGSRTPVTMPQRITPALCSMLERHHPLYVNSQFNHPLEVTPEAAEACGRLAQAGIPLGNQAVLLKGINDDYNVMKKLNHELLRIRVKPYYIFHAKNVKGTTHFGTSIEKGLKIMEKLRGHTSGMAIPTYIVNAPKGLGKTPLSPDYLVSLSPEKAVIRTWEDKLQDYPNKED